MALRAALILLVFTCYQSHCQSKLSSKFNHANVRATNDSSFITLSIGVRSLDQFHDRYNNRITTVSQYSHTIIVKAKQNIISELASDPNITFIDIAGNTKAEGGSDYFNTAFNKINIVRQDYPTLKGDGQKIFIKEQRYDTTNIDLIHRSFSTALEATASSQHASTIATIIAGAGNSSETAEGVASHARIGSCNFENILPDADEYFVNNNIHLENHSYGVDIENYYGNEATSYDEQVAAHPTIMHVFSVGNSGSSIPSTGVYSNLAFANLSGNFKQAKNILTVTSVDTSFNINAKNSRGPSYDGRLKPELTAFGQDGTSDAAALTTGIISLLQQRYFDLHQTYPTTSELKAILIATANDIDAKGIDFNSGYGSINASRALSLINKGSFTTNTISGSEVDQLEIDVPASTHKLMVVLTWIDPPAIQNASTALVNDLDGILSNDNNSYYPWVLSSFPKADSLSAQAKRKPDHLNNVEYFTIDEPAQGTYKFKIKALNISGNQSYTVAYWLEEEKPFRWNYPIVTDKLEGGKRVKLIWDSYHQATGSLSLQLGNNSWRLLRADVDLSKPYSFTPPDTLCWAKLKMSIGEQRFVSDSFLISSRPSLAVAFNCNNQFALAWNAVPGIAEYEVYTLGEKYLKLAATVSDTTLTLAASNNYYYTVAPKISSLPALRSQTIDYSNQGTLCYINLFDAQRYAEDHDRITIQLHLSTLLNIDHVNVYKIVLTDTALISTTLSHQLLKEERWYDADLKGGRVTYFAEVILSNGSHITSEAVEILIEQKNQVILFPNPVEDEINILSEGKGYTAVITNTMGDVIVVKDLSETLDYIDSSSLHSGLYILVLMKGDKVIDSKRFMKH